MPQRTRNGGSRGVQITRDSENEELMAWAKAQAQRIDLVLYESLHRFSSPGYLAGSAAREGHAYDERGIELGVIEPARYMLNLGGKRLRPLTTMLVMEAFSAKPDHFLEFAVVPEVIHTGTMLHDDIEDGSTMRRGKQATHLKFGVPKILNLGDVMFFMPLNAIKDSKKIDEKQKAKMLGMCVEDMTRLGVGQGVEIVWHNFEVSPFAITEKQVLQVLADKTGALTGIAMKIGAIIGGADDKTVEKIGRAGKLLGVGFQIQDDILNITPSRVSDTKGGVGEDITEGKITVLVVHALKHSPKKDAERLVEILKSHTRDHETIDEAIGIVKKSGAIEHANELKEAKIKEALKLIEEAVPESPARDRLQKLLTFSISRVN